MSKFNRGHSKAAKLTPEQVYALLQEYEEGASQGSLSRKYGISVGQVGRICRGESWQNMPKVKSQEEWAAEAAASAQRVMDRLNEDAAKSPEVMALRVEKELEGFKTPDDILAQARSYGAK